MRIIYIGLKMKIITLVKTKELLGITATTYDTQITRYIPIIDSKVKQITGNRYNMQIIGATTISSKDVTISGLKNSTGGIQNFHSLDDLEEYIKIGSLISGTGIADGAYIDEMYFNTSDYPIITLSAVATETASNVVLYLGIPIGLQTIVAKGIYWMITQESTGLPSFGLTSKSIGGTSKSWTDSDSKIDGSSGMPAWFCKAFPKYMGGH